MVKHQSHLKKRGLHALDGSTWTVSELMAAYNAPTGLAGGGAVAIIEFGGGTYSGDAGKAAVMNNYPTPSLHDVNAGLNNSPGGDADGEVALDDQNVAEAYSYSTGKPAQIYNVWADSDQSGLDAVAKLIDSGVNIKAVSISWGTDESDMGNDAAVQSSAAYDAFYAKYQVPVFVSSGDNDDGAGSSTVSCPAIYPSCIGVSGTTKTRGSEYVWNSGRGEGTGGGQSEFFPMPDYQKGVIPSPASGSWRTTGDVSSVADPATGFIVITGGQSGVVGGTSAAAPFWAGMVAAWNLPKVDIIKALYAAAKDCFVPVTTGSNNPRGSGNWPGSVCCGLGVPNGKALYQALLEASGVSSAPTSAPTVPVTVSPVSPPPPPPPVPSSVTGQITLTGTLQEGLFHRGGTLTLSGTVVTPLNSGLSFDPSQSTHQIDLAVLSNNSLDQNRVMALINTKAQAAGVSVSWTGTRATFSRAKASSFNWAAFLHFVVQVLAILAAAGLL